MTTDYGTGGNPVTPYKPIPGRLHPREGSIQHLATPVYRKGMGDKRPVMIGLVNEECRKRQYTLAKTRSLQGNVNATAKIERFTRTNEAVDSDLDAPAVVKPLQLTGEVTWQPNDRAWQGARSLRRAKRAMRAFTSL